MKTTEDLLEQTALSWFKDLGYSVKYGPDIAFDGSEPEREEAANYSDVILAGRFRRALEGINPDLPSEAIDEAMRAVTTQASPSLIENNRTFHRQLTDGVDVSWMTADGEKHGKVWLIDLADIDGNDWLAVNQFTVVENKRERRPDIVIFMNGIPVAVFELKNPADEKATIDQAFNQLQTYKQQISGLFCHNEMLVISDGILARFGTLTAGRDRFMPWRTVDGVTIAPGELVELEVLIKGMFDRRWMIDYMLNFITFEDDGGDTSTIAKKAAGYHQYHAANRAVEYTLSACGIKAEPGSLYGRFIEAAEGDPFIGREGGAPYGVGTDHFGGRRIGVIWHTQGSGKSLSMAFYAGKVIRHPAMENPTILVVTDRNDLDDQLFGTFTSNNDLLRQMPVQAESRTELRELLSVASGGVIFTTIQKFFPDSKGEAYGQLSERSNIVVIADEAHRSQYDFIDGFARHLHDALPNASFIGFTGTPVEKEDRSTPAVFGDYIDRYDIMRAVKDNATVPIYYESRLARIELSAEEKPKIDPEFAEITEAEEEEARKQRMRSKWASLEAMVGTEKRIGLVAEDLVDHCEARQEAMAGKAMIVCMSRRICVDMYEALVKLRPEWQDSGDDKGEIKVVMSGSASDELSWQPHIRSKKAREAIAKRFKDHNDSLKVVIVRDMWLTGFDCPSLHTMYVDKPMSGHNLMQAIARVNRVFRDKPGGLVVDYLGLADELRKALQTYTTSGGKGDTTIDLDQAASILREKYEIVLGIVHGFDFRSLLDASLKERLEGLKRAADHIIGLEDGKKRYLEAVSRMSKAFALSVPHEDALAIRDEVGLFQEIRSVIVKNSDPGPGKSPEEMESAIRQLVSKAISSRDVIDIFAEAGLNKPDISLLSDEFLAEVKQIPYKNLALEALKKLINDEIRIHMRKNVVQARSFAEMLETAVNKYANRAIEAAEVIEELIRLAKEMREARKRGEKLGLTEDEIAFYDALEVSDSAVKIMGDETLKEIAKEMVDSVKRSVSVDWTRRENARAHIRVKVKRILRKHGYPPDKEEKATNTVLEQAEVLCHEWVGE